MDASRVAVAFLALGVSACGLGHHLRRNVSAQASDRCITDSLGQVKDISGIREVFPRGERTIFYWHAEGASDESANGWVTMEDSGLVLVAERLEGRLCHGIGYGRAVLDAIFVELRRRCLAVLDHPSVREECDGECNCPSDGGLRGGHAAADHRPGHPRGVAGPAQAPVGAGDDDAAFAVGALAQEPDRRHGGVPR